MLPLGAVALAAALAAPSVARAAPGAAGGVLASPSRCAANKAAGTLTYLSPFGYDASAGIIDVYAAQKLGYFAALCLSVDFVADASDPYTLVSSGKATVTAEGSAADDLAAVADGLHLTAVATYGDVSDYAILTQPHITSLRQLEGRTLAYHSMLPVVLTEMLKNAGVDTAKVHFVNDPSYDPTLLVRGTFQGLQAYQSNEPLTLRADHDAFREWTPSQFGVKGTFNVQVMNAGFVKAHPGAASDFLRAELHAFSYCVSAPSTCVGYLTAAGGAGSNTAHALAEWRLESALALHHTLRGAGVGVQSIAEWTPEAHAVTAYGVAKSIPALGSVEDTTMAASLYRGATLVWPGT